MNELLQKHHQYAYPDTPHNIKSVRSGLFWYWLLLDNFLVCLRLLLVLRKDANLEMRSKMKAAVSLKALKNKDRMCVKTAVEVLSRLALNAANSAKLDCHCAQRFRP